ncbi:MAG: hypothetical protein DME97_14695 [Verrucomicrobia bacterium]|nr:MAG: hypothetical protein DME97_14695 [Verrucomicrobiota bacterium]
MEFIIVTQFGENYEQAGSRGAVSAPGLFTTTISRVRLGRRPHDARVECRRRNFAIYFNAMSLKNFHTARIIISLMTRESKSKLTI